MAEIPLLRFTEGSRTQALCCGLSSVDVQGVDCFGAAASQGLKRAGRRMSRWLEMPKEVSKRLRGEGVPKGKCDNVLERTHDRRRQCRNTWGGLSVGSDPAALEFWLGQRLRVRVDPSAGASWKTQQRASLSTAATSHGCERAQRWIPLPDFPDRLTLWKGLDCTGLEAFSSSLQLPALRECGRVTVLIPPVCALDAGCQRRDLRSDQLHIRPRDAEALPSRARRTARQTCEIIRWTSSFPIHRLITRRPPAAAARYLHRQLRVVYDAPRPLKSSPMYIRPPPLHPPARVHGQRSGSGSGA